MLHRRETAGPVKADGFGKQASRPAFYRSPSQISTSFVPIGISAALVVGKIARRFRISETRARLIAELADIRGGVE